MCSFKFITNNISALRCESVEVKKSYGLQVAKLAGVPEAVIVRAQQALQLLQQNEHLPPSTQSEDSIQEQETDPGALAIAQQLRQLDVDNLSARAALELLYESVSPEQLSTI